MSEFSIAFRILLLSLCILVFSSFVFTFNVDTENCVRHRGSAGSMFGFSVAEHREGGNSWVLVGAPEAQTAQPDVTRGGSVYRCKVKEHNSCDEIIFDKTGNNVNNNERVVDSKSYQWFGASVASSGENGVVVACAPRYVWFSSDQKRRDPVGTCYVSKNHFTNFSEYSPCRTRNWGYHRQGSCTAGLGVSVSQDGGRLYIGAVGSWYWQGQLFSIDSNIPLNFPPYYSQIRDLNIMDSGQVFSQNLSDRQEFKSTLEGPTSDDDSYLGYSVTSGRFSGESGVAVGMPRGAGLLGKVVLYTWAMTNLQNITGEQLGAYFAYSLATSDVDGDGTDDLIIGAPLYTDLSNNAGHYETGRVYIVYQGRETYKFRRLDTRDGKNSKARFGLSLCNLGDINKDGYGDFAVGAPYDGTHERGVVYIYHGSSIGARAKPSQIITAEQVGFPGSLTTFGFSLAGGTDLDENQYPDLVIGAYEANAVFVLRSRPVVKVKSNLTFSSDSKQISLEEKNCTLKDNTKVTCLRLAACLVYTGVGVDEQTNLNVQILLDSKKLKGPRMFFLSNEGKHEMNQTLLLTKGSQFCINMFIYVKPNVRDKLTSLEAEMRYQLQDLKQSSRHRLLPILDLDDEAGLVSRDSVSIQKNCGKDNVCIPDLRLNSVPSVDRYILGSGDRMEVEVSVENNGEDSFETSFDMGIPSGLNYVNIDRYNESDPDIPTLCSAPSYLNNNTLHCDIGNPLPSKKMVHFKVLLQPAFQETLKPRYEFWMSVNSTNPEVSATTGDNLKDLTVPIFVETNLIVEGSSHPTDLYYNSSLYESETITEEGQAGPQLVHIYNIRNKGPSDIVEAEAYFLWPSYTVEGDNLLYLLEQPDTSGPIQCEAVDIVNEKRLTLEKKKSSLETTGVIGVQNAFSSGSRSSFNKDGSTMYMEEKSFQTSSSSSMGNQKFDGGKKVVTGGGKTYITSGGAEYSGAQGGQMIGGSSSTSYSGTRVVQQPGGKVAYETSVADLAAASNQGVTTVEDGNEEIRSNVIHEEKSSIQYGSIPQLQTSYQKSSGGSVSGNSYATSNVGYTGSDARGYSATGAGGYSASSSGNRYVGSGATESNNRNRYAGESSVSSEGNSAWAQAGGKASGIDLDVNIGGLKKDSFYSKEHASSSNTTWDPVSGPITSSSNQWRTNDNGKIRNGSSSHVYGGQTGHHYSSAGDDAARTYEENRKASESESVYKWKAESEKRYSSSKDDDLNEYSDEDVYNPNSNSYDPEKAKQEQDRRYQEELRRYHAEVKRIEQENALKRKQEEEIRKKERERYLEEQRRLRQYQDYPKSDEEESYRYKRDIDSSDEALEKALKCGPTKCIRIKCNVGPLQKDQEAWVAFRSRVWVPTIRKIALNKEVSLSSLLVARVTKIPHLGKPDQATIKTHEIFTKVIPRETGVPPGMVPLWVVVLSAVAGAIILMLLVYLLYKWGFFKRNRPNDAPEKEPLNRNGYQHADD